MSVIRLSPDTYFSTDDGIVISRERAEALIKGATQKRRNQLLVDNICKVTGVDRSVINLNLQGLNSNVPAVRGFLVEVYLSGSDGSLTRMYSGSIVDPADHSLVRGGYQNYIKLEFDV